MALHFSFAFLLGHTLAIGQDVLSVLSSRASLLAFTTLISTHPNLVHIAEAGNFTILAPTNQAFDLFFTLQTPVTNYSTWDQTEVLLSYHILQGVHTRGFVTAIPQFLYTSLKDPRYTNVTGGQTIQAVLRNDQAVFRGAVNSEAGHVDGEADIVLPGGVIHVIDTVLTPPLDVLGTVSVAPFPGFIDLISQVIPDQDFSTHIANVSTFPDATHFIADNPSVPINASKAGSSAAEILDSINYNNIFGQVLYSTDFKNGSSFATAAGVNVTITIGLNGAMWVNDAKITRSDVLVSNGVIHVLDKLLDLKRVEARPHWDDLIAPSPSAPSSKQSTHLPRNVAIGVIIGVVLVVTACIIAASLFYHHKTTKAAAKAALQRKVHESSHSLVVTPELPPTRSSVPSQPVEMEVPSQVHLTRNPMPSRVYEVHAWRPYSRYELEGHCTRTGTTR